MANRFVGGILSSKQPQSGGFVSRASTGTYFNNTGTLVTAPVNQPRLNYSFNGSPINTRYSGLFSGSSQLSVAQTTATDLGSANFTIEMWIYFTGQNTTGASNNNIVGKWNSGSQWILQFRAAGLDSVTNQHWRFYFNSSVGTDFQEASTTAVQLNVWYHIAVVRNGSNFIFYRNGAQVGSTYTNAASITATSDTLTIGSAQSNAYGVTGYISNFRLVTGTAVYTGSYTVPTGPFTATQSANPFGGSNTAAIASGTQVLTLQNNGFTDFSSNNFSLTNTSVTPSIFLPPIYTPDFSGTGWYNPSVLIEPASTNIITYSQGSMTTGWTAFGGSGTITNNVAIAPDGTQTAASFTESTAAGAYFIFLQGISVVAGTPYTASFYVKAVNRIRVQMAFSNYGNWVGGNGVTVGFDLVTGTFSPISSTPTAISMTNAGNGWWRISVTGTPLVTMASNMFVQLDSATSGAFSAATNTYTGNGQVGIYVWGAQLEANKYGPTSYIPTTSTAVTRAQDNVGPLGSGVYTLAQLENQTAIDDQTTVQSFTATGSATWTAPADVTSVEVLVVAGGGGSGANGPGDGGGGGGGVLYNTNYPVTPGTTYPVVVGGGGARITNGGNSQFATLIAVGGGGGGEYASVNNRLGQSGGSGGGGSGRGGGTANGGQGIAGQGYAGATGSSNTNDGGGGGGGAGGTGISGIGGASGAAYGGAGGPGLYFNISGTSTAYGGGGGGGTDTNARGGAGGVGGGGSGQGGSTNNTSGTANTGGGAGAGTITVTGGSGIVIVKYKRTNSRLTAPSNSAIVTQKFTTTNTWTVPAGVTQVEALVVAGGGGGGYGRDVTNTGSFGAGGGGAGGLIYNSSLSVTPGTTYNIGVGAGGLGAQGTTGAANQGYNGFGSGIASGTELITNGSGFTATTGWSATTATLSVPQAGIFRITPNASVNGTASQSITTAIGTTYLLLIKVTYDASKLLRVRIGTTQVGGEVNDSCWTTYTKDSLDGGSTGAGYYSQTFTATATTTWINLQIGGGTGQLTDISYISVKQATIAAFGGGGGGGVSNSGTYQSGLNGGSGGGAGAWSPATGNNGAGVAGQGTSGGLASATGESGGGGGGAGQNGQSATVTGPKAGDGGAGLPYSITGNLEYYAGGGAGSSDLAGTIVGRGGIGGGGGAGNGLVGGNYAGGNGASNTGGGGGGAGGYNASPNYPGGNGGSGVVILRYRVPTVAVFQDIGTWTCPAGVTNVQALVVAGGGGGGPPGGGGGGAGGLVYSSSVPVTPGTTYSVIVGQGGDGGVYNTVAGASGKNSSFAGIVAFGGGAGGGNGFGPISGGSGGGSSGNFTSNGVGSGTYGQGNAGGAGTNTGNQGNGGGGGAGSAGVNGGGGLAGPGGAGLAYSISGASVTYAGGGGGSGGSGGSVAGAAGGAGGGGLGGTGTINNPTPGLINTGGGGGGYGNGGTPGAHGGSGIVIIRYYGG